MAEVKTKFYQFQQNNSGGSFDKDDKAGIGPNVWIEAVDVPHAISRALAIGIYFDGCRTGRDCSCCGDRWYEPYGNGVEQVAIDEAYNFTWHPTVYVHRIDGTIERINKEEAPSA